MALMGHHRLAKLQTSINLPFLDPTSILCIQMSLKPLASPHSQNLPPGLPLIDPQVWDFKAPSVAQHHSPIQFFLKNPSQVITQTQHTLTTESQGLKPIIFRLLKAGLMWPVSSHHNTPISSVQSLSCIRFFATPLITARQASLSITNSQSSFKLMSIVESVMSSNPLILCRPLPLLPSIFPSIRVFSNQSVLCFR